ncbi:hypothetical protein [Streptobacillus moniliformis]|uniref:Uncharacterized protein n=1 Tax=Streptobacillus moniliformis (strain ATCC 14647 / DSM 12112 / NCTC 10651 / 9901) TaxID=519441 RepID=D1AXP0_STRM9|nr:hypothetical protein [Streptobacillus moniliformis]ACZ01066.1 hypothetical protein Smon_0588 [Streptobacillus moniliformis DSM 12112]AVL42567.1 hypothetical protein CEP89_01225 [Streptobacillus moniliformis]QXW65839.1 hypothetical protein KX935_00835 [Streptobacillus moniliformis]SQA13792.1 Uncharacterised protein [Streptobacillus moniliformis]
MKNIEDMKEFEFSELLSKTKFNSTTEESNSNKRIDEDGDEIREEFLEEVKVERDSKLHRYISFATGFVYTILSPLILLLGIYFAAENIFLFKRNNLVIILLILIGILTGYWTLYKDIKKITAKRERKNGNKNKEIK